MADVDIKEFFEANKEAIKKLVATDHLSRTKISELKYEFTSSSGKSYYSFPEKMQLPFMRMAKGMEYMEWLRNGISPEDFDRIRKELNVSLANIRAKTKDAEQHTLKAGMLVAEMDRRRVSALPYYVLINLCANYLVREDEDPQVISSQIMDEKCDDIQYEIELGNNSFFLTIPQLRPLSVTLKLSLPELTQWLNELNTEAEKDKNYLKAYLSWTESMKEQKTSATQ